MSTSNKGKGKGEDDREETRLEEQRLRTFVDSPPWRQEEVQLVVRSTEC